MLQYIVRRLLLAIPILVAVVTLVFFVVRMAPGDPAQVILGDSASQESLTALRAELGLDRPILVQYGEFLFSIIKGDLGNSIIRKQSINSMIAEVLPYTIELTLAGVLVGVILGLPLGVFSAVFRNSAADYGVRIMSLLGLSFPSFYSGILLLLAIYLFIILRGLYIATQAQDTFSRLLGGALTLVFFVYLFVNSGMVSGVLPVVGVPLPLISYGGSSLVVSLMAVALLFRIHHENVNSLSAASRRSAKKPARARRGRK